MPDHKTSEYLTKLDAILKTLHGKPLIAIAANPGQIIEAVETARIILGDVLIRLGELEKERAS